MIIYKITNLINNKIYIGQTRCKLRDRWNSHCKNKNKSLITAAINKYGRENFTIKEIDRAETLIELNKKEAQWIKYYDSTNKQIGYNIMLGGDSSTSHNEETRAIISKKAKQISDETRKKMRQAKLGKKQTPDQIQARIASRRGYKWTEESKEKSRQKQKGRPKNPESIAKMAEKHRGKKQSPEHVKKRALKIRGRKATPEQREKYRQAALKREAKRREKSGI